MRLVRSVGVVCGAATAATALSAWSGGRKLERARRWQGDGEAERFEGAAGRKQAVVVGAGCVGVSLAYSLAVRGYEVVVVDSASGVGQECSACAAGGMQRSNPVVDAATFRQVVSSLFRSSPSYFHIDPWATLSDPHFARWMARFAWATLRAPADKIEREQHMLAFTQWAIQRTEATIERLGIADACGYGRRGALAFKVDPTTAAPTPAPTPAAPADAKVSSTRRYAATVSHSLEPKVRVGAEQALQLEPCLRHHQPPVVAGDHEPETAMGDSQRFTEHLAAECERLGVRFLLNTPVVGVETEEDVHVQGARRVASLTTAKGRIALPKDAQVVFAAGSWTPQLLWHVGLFLPVYPLKGYTLVMDLPPAHDPARPKDADLPHGIVYDSGMYASRLGGRVRMASIGELGGWGTAPRAVVDEQFRGLAVAQLPQLRDLIDKTPTWCGLRPFVADGALIMGRLPTLSNAFVNVGPGFNGWKICAGGAEVVASVMDGVPVDEVGGREFSAAVLSPHNRVFHSPLFARVCADRWLD